MTKKIIAQLNDGTFCTIFDQANSGFSDIQRHYKDPLFTNENTFSFDPERKIESDEWFYIEPNAEQKSALIQPYINTLTNIDSVNPIQKEDYPNIRAISLVETSDDSEKLIVTRVFPRFYTMSKKMLRWENGPALIKQSASVDFTGIIDAFWQNGKLYFKYYAKIKPIFDGLEDFYRTATEKEKNDFLQKDFFECPNASMIVRTRNMRRIASVIDKIDWANPKVLAKYIRYANKYQEVGVEITSNGKIKLESNKDLTQILNILEERIYTTPITNEIREANSVTPIR